MEGNRSNDVAEVPTWYERKGSCGTAKDQQQNNFPAVMSVQTGSAQPRNGATVFSQGREPLDSDATDPSSPGGATGQSDVSVAPAGLFVRRTHSVPRGSRPWLTTVAFSRLTNGDTKTLPKPIHYYCGVRAEDSQNREVIQPAVLTEQWASSNSQAASVTLSAVTSFMQR